MTWKLKGGTRRRPTKDPVPPLRHRAMSGLWPYPWHEGLTCNDASEEARKCQKGKGTSASDAAAAAEEEATAAFIRSSSIRICARCGNGVV
eukprot:CAMPEP_0185780168 /NCGR_PEP_ID=MMETSP1174-20130828/98232_1 /TAXON_ID=35687 /ORGANISM="Dictyocha speculum, Strain CCMP1381" /LENGTH=90 /DNA_ID=CAMNT_0028469619 /DNA_START=72 /DNA_END=342 /DNA_ORIENTATION=+